MNITAGQSEKHEYACLMMDFSDELKAKILQWNFDHIPDSALVQDAGGRELKPHVTLKYGLLDEDPEKFFPVIPAKPVTFVLSTVSRFTSSPEYDVLKVEVDSAGLRALNEKISKNFRNEDSHPDYIPHLTLAYVKKGALPELDGNKDFARVADEFTTVLFTNKNNDVFKKHLDEGQTLKSMYKPVYYKQVPIRFAMVVSRK